MTAEVIQLPIAPHEAPLHVEQKREPAYEVFRLCVGCGDCFTTTPGSPYLRCDPCHGRHVRP